jgi:hypothetical protein
MATQGDYHAKKIGKSELMAEQNFGNYYYGAHSKMQNREKVHELSMPQPWKSCPRKLTI